MSASRNAAPPLSIRLFGAFEVCLNGQPLRPLRTRKGEWLLALLTLRHDRPVERPWLAGTLWPESATKQGTDSLRRALTDLRQAMGPEAARLRAPTPHTLCLSLVEAEVDLIAFDRAIAGGHEADLESAVALYRGPLLESCQEEWVLPERLAREEAYLTALERLAAEAQRRGELIRAAAYLRQAVAVDPLRETAQRALMRALAASGNRAAFTVAYREFRLLLHRELNVAPDPETQELFEQLQSEARRRPPLDPAQLRSPRTRSPAAGPRPQPLTSRYERETGPHRLPTRERIHFEDARLPAIAEGENRLATLLSADLRRFREGTRRLGPEEAAASVHGLLQAIMAVIGKYEGRIDRCHRDGVLAVFGVPHVHEDDAERAIRAAVEIREAARRLGQEVRVGIHTGDVSVGRAPLRGGSPGSRRSGPMRVTGPSVTLTTHLQARAQPGQILVGEVTRRLTRRAFTFTPLPSNIGGGDQPLPAYVVERAMPTPGKPYGIEGLRAKLVGREDELAKLKAALTQVLEGHGQMASLIGEAGIGKSRLVAELKQGIGVGCSVFGVRAEESEDPTPNTQRPTPTPLWLEGRALELGMTTGYSVFIDLLRGYFASQPNQEGELQGPHLAAWLQEFVSRQELSADQVEEMGPLLGHMLSLCFGTAWDERLTHAGPEQIRHQTLAAVRDLLLVLARRRPVVLVLEDLHWADRLSLDLIFLLTEALPLAPLFILCVYRPEREHPSRHLAAGAARKCPDRFTELHLRELSPAQTHALAASLLKVGQLPDPLIALIRQQSRGNPFFIEEVIRSLMAQGLVSREVAPRTGAGQRGEQEQGDAGGRAQSGSTLRGPAFGEGGTPAPRRSGGWRAQEAIAEVGVTESIQSVILSRVDRLRPELKRLLQSAAVIGRLFRPCLLEQVVIRRGTPDATENSPAPLPTGDWRLASALWELEEEEMIYRERVLPEEEYSFRHVLMQQTIYQSMGERQRAMLHQEAGEAIEALWAGRWAEQIESLAYHYERSECDEKAVEYLLKAGAKARRAYLNEAAVGYFQRALERLGRTELGQTRPDWRVEALRGLGQVYLDTIQMPEAEACLREAIAVGRQIGLAPREQVRLSWWLADLLWHRNAYDEMIRIGDEGGGILGADTGCVEAVLMNQIIASGHCGRGDRKTWHDQIHRITPVLESLPYSEELRAVHDCVVTMYVQDDKQPEEALRWAEALLRKAEEHHDMRGCGAAHCSFASVLANLGDLRGAIAHHRLARELYTRIGDLKMVGATQSGGYWLALGELQQAEEAMDRAQELNKALGNQRIGAGSYLSIGTVALCRGLSEQAVAAFQTAAQLFRAVGPASAAARALDCCARVSLRQQNRREALQQLHQAILLSRPSAPVLIGSPGELIKMDPYVFAAILSALEQAYEGPEEFRAFCCRFQEEHPEARASPFTHWFLGPAEARDIFRIPYCVLPTAPYEIRNTQYATLDPDWVWEDPLADCSVNLQNGIEIHAANGRDLWHINRSAPRLLRSIAGHFAAQTVCVRASAEKPAMGGLLLWKDRENYLRLDRGVRGKDEISFHGCIGNQDMIFGRGRLPSEQVLLRLERRSGSVRALCSAEGQVWYTVGEREFPGEDPLMTGLHAIGQIDRAIDPSAYPDGTAIRFHSFQVCRG